MRSKWEYKVIKMKPGLLGVKEENIEQELNKLGAGGWELVTVKYFGMGCILYMKKLA